MKKLLTSKEFWIVATLTIVSFALRFYRLDLPAEAVFDEVYYPKWANDYLEGRGFFDVHPPLGKLLTAISIALFGNTPFGWRAIGAFLGALIVPLTYFIAKNLFSQEIGHRKSEIGKSGESLGFLKASDPSLSLVAAGVENGSSEASRRPSAVVHNDASSGSEVERKAVLSRWDTQADFRKNYSQSINLIPTLSALFVLLDGLLLVQTRTSLLDSYLLAFSLFAYLSFLLFRNAQTRREANLLLLTTGIFLGLTIATKWTGAATYGVILLFYFLWRRQLPKVSWLAPLISLLIVPIVIYLLSFGFNQGSNDFWTYIVDWHKQTWNFHRNLHDIHPYMSRWWTWLILVRPVWYYYKDIEGQIYGIIALGNPVLWWSSCFALLLTISTLIQRHTPRLWFPFIAFLVTYAPWWVIGRTQFQYYLVAGVPFLFILLAWWFNYFWQNHYARFLVQILIVLAIAAFIFFYPLLTAYPVSHNFYRSHLWFSSWI